MAVGSAARGWRELGSLVGDDSSCGRCRTWVVSLRKIVCLAELIDEPPSSKMEGK